MMRFIRRRLLAIITIVFLVISGELVLAKTTQKNEELIQPPIEITEAFKNIPYNPDTVRNREDIDRGKQAQNITSESSSTPNNPAPTDDINKFAWKDFVALNWPVDCQGKPLSYTDPLSRKELTKIIGQAPEAPRAWELYPSPQDVFPPNGATPPSLNKLPEVDRCLNDRAGSEIRYNQNLRLTETGELVGTEEFGEVKAANTENLLDGYGELKEGISLRDIDAANHIPLVDRQGNYVINEIRLNPVEFNQIVENKWFNASNLSSFKDPSTKKIFQFVCSKGIKTLTNQKYCNKYEAEGAIEIKAVWRVFDQRNSAQEKARYYTTTRKVIGSKGEILQQQAELGLVGFHIMHKTSSRGWIWSTFEQIDNAPPCNNQKTILYTLYNNECNTENCRENLPNVKYPYLWYTSNEEPKAVTSEGIAVKAQIPSQICRINSITPSATLQNEQWQKSLRAIAESSVWQYYQLIGTEWLEAPELPYSNIELRRRQIMPVSPPLTNVALEPYAQRVSCIVCHTSAHLPGKGNSCQLNGDPKNCTDFSFLMDNAQFSEQISVQPNQ